ARPLSSLHSRQASPPPCPAYHPVDPPPVALPAHEPRRPLQQCGLDPISLRPLRGIGLGLVIAVPTPDEKAKMSLCGASERRGRAGVGFHSEPVVSTAVCPGPRRIACDTACRSSSIYGSKFSTAKSGVSISWG